MMRQELYYTDYYRSFHCIGPACGDTCCAIWEIAVDRKTFEKYKSFPGKWGKRLKKSVDGRTRCLRLKKGQGKECIFFTEDHLCRIHAELGEKMLCRSCRIFPRHMEDYGDRKEYMLSLACPEAARLILYKTEPTVLVKKEKARQSADSFAECDKALLKALISLRENMLSILHNNNMDIMLCAGLLLCMAHDIQKPLVKRDWHAVEKKISLYTEKEAEERFLKNLRTLPQQEKAQAQLKKYITMLDGLSITDLRFKAMLKTPVHFTVGEEDEESRRIYKNLFEYFIITYLLGAVYDGDVYTKVKFAVFSLIILHEFDHMHDRLQSAVLYSREIENNRYNLEALESVLHTSQEFSLEKLLFLVKCGGLW